MAPASDFGMYMNMARTIPRVLPNSSWTMTRLLELRASSRPDDLALAYLDRRYTWGEFNGEVNRWARMFLAEGIRPGDVVALMMDNRPEYLFALHGLDKVGASAALINTNLTGQPLAHAVTVGNSRKVMAGDEHAPGCSPSVAFGLDRGHLAVDGHGRECGERGDDGPIDPGSTGEDESGSGRDVHRLLLGSVGDRRESVGNDAIDVEG